MYTLTNSQSANGVCHGSSLVDLLQMKMVNSGGNNQYKGRTDASPSKTNAEAKGNNYTFRIGRASPKKRSVYCLRVITISESKRAKQKRAKRKGNNYTFYIGRASPKKRSGLR
mgnify:CR=1 FL=1